MDSPEFYFARDEEGADAGRKTIDELAALAREDRLAGVSVSENGKDGWRPASSIRELELENRRLQKALDTETLRAKAFDTMIELAESKFNIPIRKKSGTKR